RPGRDAAARGAAFRSGAASAAAGAHPDGPLCATRGDGQCRAVSGERRVVVRQRLDVPRRRRHHLGLHHARVTPAPSRRRAGGPPPMVTPAGPLKLDAICRFAGTCVAFVKLPPAAFNTPLIVIDTAPPT